MKTSMIITVTVAAALVAGCDSGPKSGRGFRLPDGSVDKGREAFVALQCHSCHTVSGAELPTAAMKAQINVVIGGEVAKIKTYGELVTAVINPSHDITAGFDVSKYGTGKASPMPDYTQTMTTRQLIDIVAFLQAHYTELKPEPYYFTAP
jgi:mono/diheme cytochrome c family protein